MRISRQFLLIAFCFVLGLFHPNVYSFLVSFIVSFPLIFLAVYGFRYYDKRVASGQLSDSLVLATLLSAVFGLVVMAA
jgi:hypothetical protein